MNIPEDKICDLELELERSEQLIEEDFNTQELGEKANWHVQGHIHGIRFALQTLGIG